jgi:hypothetical protein
MNMEIKIDTLKDSKEELRQVIKMLQSLIGESATESLANTVVSPSADASPGIFNLFQESNSATTSSTTNTSNQKPDSDTSLSSLLNEKTYDDDDDSGDEPEDKDKPEVIIVDY